MLGFILLPGSFVWNQNESVHQSEISTLLMIETLAVNISLIIHFSPFRKDSYHTLIKDSFWLQAGQNQTVSIIYFCMYVFSEA